MPTPIIKTVGSGGDYPDLATAVAAIPSSLVTADEQWELRMLTGEHTFTAQVNFATKTQDSTRYIHLTANPGAEFWANTSNPLRYGYGARLKWTGGSDGTYNWIGNLRLGDYGRLSNLQLLIDQWAYPNVSALVDGRDYCRIERCYLEALSGGSAGTVVVFQRDGNYISNSVIVRSGTDGGGGYDGITLRTSTASLVAVNRVVNCLLVRTTDRSAYGTAITNANVSAAGLVTDCMVLGNWSKAVDNSGFSWGSGSGRLVSSLADGSGNTAAPGTGNTFSITAADMVEALSSSGALNAKRKTSATNYTGQRNQTYTGDVDVYGTARSTSAPTVGAQEHGSSSDTTAPSVPGSLTLGTRTASTLPFTWAASTDSGGGSVSGYKIQVLDNADTVLSTVDVGNVLTYTVSSLSGNTLRKLRVAAYDNAVPANQSAYSSSVSGTTLSKTATVTVKDVNGSAQASETSLRWAACTGTIGSALAVVAQGTAETTDGSGNCVLDLNSTALAAGNSITVILADDSPSARLGVLEAVTVTES
jgi:hypothetical protein